MLETPSVGWLSGQKQRSVKPSGCALHRFESYPNQNYKNPLLGEGFLFYITVLFSMVLESTGWSPSRGHILRILLVW